MQFIYRDKICFFGHAVNNSLINEIFENLGIKTKGNNLERLLLLWNLLFTDHEHFTNFVNDVQGLASIFCLVNTGVWKVVDLRFLLLIFDLEPRLLESFPPLLVSLLFETCLELSVLFDDSLVLHVLLHPEERIIFAVNCDRAPNFLLQLVPKKVCGKVQDVEGKCSCSKCEK